jgi:hypothetical protein
MLVAAPESPRCRQRRRPDRGVGALPQIVGDERRVLAGKFFSVHAHPAGIKRARDQAAHDVGAETLFADVLFFPAAAVENARPGAPALGVERVCNLGEGSETGSHFKNAAQGRGFGWVRAQSLEYLIVDVAERDLSARPKAAFCLLVEFDTDFFGGVQPLVFRDAHEQIVLQPAGRAFVGKVFGRTDEPAAVLLEEGAERSPFVRASQHALEFEDQDDLDFAGLDLPHEGADTGAVHRTARVGRVGKAGDFEPAVVGVFCDMIATDGGLALAGVEAPPDLIGGGDAAVDGNGHRAGTAPRRTRLNRRHGSILG